LSGACIGWFTGVLADTAESGGSDDVGIAGDSGGADDAGVDRGADAPFPLLDDFAALVPLAAAPFDAGVNGGDAVTGRDRPVDNGMISGGGPLELSCRETRH
jgi:hypothetical protein